MLKILGILWNSFRMALQELKVNKLRTFLSLLGVTFGIFCIIGVLALVNSLENKVQSDVKQLGTNTIYIDKWEYSGGSDYPWWKFVNRPIPKYNEALFIKERSTLASGVSYFNSTSTNLIYENDQLNDVEIYGVSEDFNKIQTVDIAAGRYLGESEFTRGNPMAVIGYENAVQLFGNAEKAVGKTITFNGNKTVVIIGVIEKQGYQLIGTGFNFDNCLIVSYRYFASVYDVNGWSSHPFIMVQGKDKIPSGALVDELRGIMRQVRKISPRKDDDFALNDINMFSEQLSDFFGKVNFGGWIIAALSLLVGIFSVANIMFVTVRERTSQIGLKKAIGAKKSTILAEFLLESAFLCLLGGFIGLTCVWLLTLIVSAVLPFPITIAGNIVITAVSLCVIIGVISGIIPAFIAAKMNPVDAIRST